MSRHQFSGCVGMIVAPNVNHMHNIFVHVDKHFYFFGFDTLSLKSFYGFDFLFSLVPVCITEQDLRPGLAHL